MVVSSHILERWLVSSLVWGLLSSLPQLGQFFIAFVVIIAGQFLQQPTPNTTTTPPSDVPAE